MPRIIRLISLQKTPKNPYPLFEKWFRSAVRARVKLPHAMTLCTATRSGRPSARVVLMKEVGRKGIVFYTNYGSRKAHELRVNPRATLLFYWRELDLQIRIEGRVRKVPARVSEEYFMTRPRESQLGAHASRQSRPLRDQEDLFRAFWKYAREFEGKPVPRPENWGGYVLDPYEIEFWKGRDFRLHDRLLYRKAGGRWKKTLLMP